MWGYGPNYGMTGGWGYGGYGVKRFGGPQSCQPCHLVDPFSAIQDAAYGFLAPVDRASLWRGGQKKNRCQCGSHIDPSFSRYDFRLEFELPEMAIARFTLNCFRRFVV